jgi:DNA-binding transcriptional regulator YdaS (Cro superfamily)
MRNPKPTKKGRDLLRAFMNSLATTDQVAFAKTCGTTVGQLRQIAHGFRPAHPAIAVAIDRESKSQVPMDELAPGVDWNHVKKAMRRRK